jgi:hypothetical protein
VLIDRCAKASELFSVVSWSVTSIKLAGFMFVLWLMRFRPHFSLHVPAPAVRL